MKIKCIIVNNDPLTIESIKKHFENFSDFEIISVFNDSIEAFNFLTNTIVNVIFWDIDKDLLSHSESIKLISPQSQVIITSNAKEFTPENSNLEILDYLIKPITLNRFVKCVNKITIELYIKNTQVPYDELYLFIKEYKKVVKIMLNEILFIEGMKEYIKVVTINKTYITYKALSALLEELPIAQFIQVHKSYIVALNKIKSIKNDRIWIENHIIPIGGSYNKKIKSKLLEQIPS